MSRASLAADLSLASVSFPAALTTAPTPNVSVNSDAQTAAVQRRQTRRCMFHYIYGPATQHSRYLTLCTRTPAATALLVSRARLPQRCYVEADAEANLAIGTPQQPHNATCIVVESTVATSTWHSFRKGWLSGARLQISTSCACMQTSSACLRGVYTAQYIWDSHHYRPIYIYKVGGWPRGTPTTMHITLLKCELIILYWHGLQSNAWMTLTYAHIRTHIHRTHWETSLIPQAEGTFPAKKISNIMYFI